MDITEITRLAAAINALRPDWPQASLVTFITRELSQRAYRDVSMALAYVACDPASQTPRRVLEAGPWWDAVAAGSGIAPPTPTPPPLRSCRTCGAYITEPDHEQHCARRATAETYAAGAAAVRAELAAARAAHPTPPKETTP